MDEGVGNAGEFSEEADEPRSPGYSASVASLSDLETEEIPFRAIDMLASKPVFRRDLAVPAHSTASEGGNIFGSPSNADASPAHEPGHDSKHDVDNVLDVQTEHSFDGPDQQWEPQCDTEEFAPQQHGVTLASAQWNEIIASSFAQFQQTQPALRLPWEVGTMAAVFNIDENPLPQCLGLAEMDRSSSAQSSDSLQQKLTSFTMPHGASFVHAVKSMRDMNFFEEKSQRLDLACAQWLNILSIDWSASGVGPQLAASLQKDHSGSDATMILRSCFGVKSPSTLLKRAGSIQKFLNWFDRSDTCRELGARAIPLQEPVVWEFFVWLKQQRLADAKGYTVPSAFLETVRFCRFTLDLHGTEGILGSRRLLGFAALERQAKGPSRQAPPLELVHIRRLHEVLEGSGNVVDRLGAGCFLICLYGRARWSDVRYVEHVELTAHECLTLYTSEHKTASVGLRREQYLPIVVPWDGITNDPWLETFMEVYDSCGLQLNRRPLGPLLPAPRVDGTFCARPLTTSEAAEWLRGLLHGTPDHSSFRSHSLKATLLGWGARAGLDKETRAVLGHHCSSLNGSEVVYSRQLQTRALRKLGLILKRVRMGLSLEDDAMRELGVISTPPPLTPRLAATMPVLSQPAAPSSHAQVAAAAGEIAVDAAVGAALELEELQSVKEEQLDLQTLEEAADRLTLFPVELVSAGVIEIESSSGRDSDSSGSSSDSSTSSTKEPGPKSVRYCEDVPANVDYFRHHKSGILHSCKLNETVSKCKVSMGPNFRKLPRTFYFRYPKCIKCFPSDNGRIRNREQLTESLDQFLKRAKASDSNETEG